MSSEEWTRDSRRTLTLILVVFALRAALTIAVVPPWQAPDEPGHFEYIQILSLQDTLNLSERPSDTNIQRLIVGSMAEHGWWKHFGEPKPNPLPTDFSEVSHGVSSVTLSPPLYYLVGAGVLRSAEALKLTGFDDLVGRYNTVRWLSVVFAVLTLVCVWAGVIRLFGLPAATGVTLLTALHPQFTFMSTAVNPDALANLFGAVIWWQCARLVTGGAAAQSIVLMGCAAVAGVLTKRVAVPFVLMVAVSPAVAAWFGPAGVWRVSLRVLGIAVGCLTVAVVAAGAWFGEEVLTIPRFPIAPGNRVRELWGYLMAPLMEAVDRMNGRWPDWAFFQRFTSGMFDSFWLKAGWLRYSPPPAWLLTVKLLTVGAVAGCLLGARRAGLAQWRAGLVLAGVLVGIQVVAVYVSLYLNGTTGQGRYLFPVIGPAMALFWVGVHSWWPQRAWPFVGVLLVTVMFALDVVSWFSVFVPAYLR